MNCNKKRRCVQKLMLVTIYMPSNNNRVTTIKDEKVETLVIDVIDAELGCLSTGVG